MSELNRRDRTEVLRDVLECLHEKPRLYTQIMCCANVNSQPLNRYLDALLGMELASYVMKGRRKQYFLTPQGHEFYQTLNEVVCVIDLCRPE